MLYAQDPSGMVSTPIISGFRQGITFIFIKSNLFEFGIFNSILNMTVRY